MKKEILTKLIQKYSLGGNISSVLIKTDGTTSSLTTSFVSDNKDIVGSVNISNFKFQDAEIGINDTEKLKSLLSVMSDEIDLKLKANKAGSNIALTISDKSTTANCVLADTSVIPPVPKVKSSIDFDVVIDFDKEFISKFIRAKSALNDVNTFTLIEVGGKLKLIIGYATDINANTISFDVKAQNGKDKLGRTISFNAKMLKEILTANSEVDSATYHVFSQGISYIQFKKDDFQSEYYLLEVKLD